MTCKVSLNFVMKSKPLQEGEGVGTSSHVKETGVLVENFKKNP